MDYRREERYGNGETGDETSVDVTSQNSSSQRRLRTQQLNTSRRVGPSSSNKNVRKSALRRGSKTSIIKKNGHGRRSSLKKSSRRPAAFADERLQPTFDLNSNRVPRRSSLSTKKHFDGSRRSLNRRSVNANSGENRSHRRASSKSLHRAPQSYRRSSSTRSSFGDDGTPSFQQQSHSRAASMVTSTPSRRTPAEEFEGGYWVRVPAHIYNQLTNAPRIRSKSICSKGIGSRRSKMSPHRFSERSFKNGTTPRSHLSRSQLEAQRRPKSRTSQLVDSSNNNPNKAEKVIRSNSKASKSEKPIGMSQAWKERHPGWEKGVWNISNVTCSDDDGW